MMSRTGLSGAMFVVALAIGAKAANAQSFEVDFSRSAGPPLVKTKFGVYQTPLVTLPRLLESVPLLREINVRDLRYEIGWGKPESLAASQIGGTKDEPRYDFSALDALVERLKLADVKPLLALGYCPNPLKSRDEWAGWKDTPSDLEMWQKINRDYALHLSRAKANPSYEVWNEPDMPEPGGKMFFSGTPQNYGQLYGHAAAGVRQGDGDALVGGPAAAWNLAYLAPILSQPIDFASIHGYDNYPAQLGQMRAALAKRPDLPIFLTEYASFTDLPANGPQSRHPGAMRFFRDVKGLLNYPDVTKVYWAQWLDAGDGPGMGFVTWDGHRKAIFNAFKLYGLMPVDRVAVEPDGLDGVNLMASRDKHRACVALWNESSTERRVQLNLQQLPFAGGAMWVYRIDGQNASFVDNPASENLRAIQRTPLQGATSAVWNGAVPAEGVVFLDASDGTQEPPAAPKLGTYIRSYHWFSDRTSKAYADFDTRTGTARLGMGDTDLALAQIGNLIENPAPVWRVQVESSSFRGQDQNSLFGLRLDFPSQTRGYSRSVLFHNGLYDARRSSALSWGKGGAVPDRAIFQRAMNTGLPFEIDLRRIAPANWNRKRVLVTFLMQNAGRGSRAKFTLTKP